MASFLRAWGREIAAALAAGWQLQKKFEGRRLSWGRQQFLRLVLVLILVLLFLFSRAD